VSVRLERARALAASFAVACLLAGCASVLGIPDDITRGAPGDDGGPNNGDDEGGSPEGGKESGPPSDGGGGGDADAADGDGGVVVGTCDPAKDFTAPTLLTGISTAANEGSARLSDDELTIYFDSDRAGGGGGGSDLWTATRATPGAAFGAPSPIGGVNTALEEYSPSVTSDGLQLFFEQQDNGGISRLYTAKRAAASGPFSGTTALTTLNSNDYTANPFVRGTGSEIWYVNETAPLLGIDIWHATLQAGVYVGTKLAVVNTNAEEYAPIVTKDGLTLFFGSDAKAALAGINVYVATRPSTAVDFGAPTLLTSVSSGSDDQPTWVSVDGCRLYLASDRPGGAGAQDIWVATRPK
jgi:hypothetical protein